LVTRRIDAALELVRGKTVACLQRACVGGELLGRAHLVASVGIAIAKEQIAGKGDLVAKPAPQQLRYRDTQPLAHDVETGELERSVDLRAVVVETGRGIADCEAHRLE